MADEHLAATTEPRVLELALSETEAEGLRDKLSVPTGASYPELDWLLARLHEFCEADDA